MYHDNNGHHELHDCMLDLNRRHFEHMQTDQTAFSQNQESELLCQAYDRLVSKAGEYLNESQLAQLNDAYEFGRNAHHGQYRKSGEPYFTHPIAVAEILAALKLDVQTLITALLHDTLEDCPVSSDDISARFSQKIAELVNGVTKLSQIEIQSFDNKQAENFRKFMLAISRDVRVLIVKLADRTHNMRTIGSMSDEKQNKIARETMDIFAPLADRMGIYVFQHELEDLSFNVLQPQVRTSIINSLDNITDLLDQKGGDGKNLLDDIASELEALVQDAGIACSVEGRLKTPYSIYLKMKRKAMSFEQLFDVNAFRIIVPDIAACYQTLGIIHQQYPTIIGRFKDYISAPKKNGYQSIHTSVLGPYNQKIEIQIRTDAMHEMAEKGVAAHWAYKVIKQDSAEQKTTHLPPRIKDDEHDSTRWIRELTSLLGQSTGSVEFMEAAKLELYRDQIFCFSPKGELFNLPSGATALDFAYSVHSDLGDYCDHVLINGKRRQLSTVLENGDQVKVITSDKMTVKIEWEEFVKTARAESHIRRMSRTLTQQQFASLGKSLLSDEFRYRGQPFDEDALKLSLLTFNLSSLGQLYMLVGEGKTLTKEMVLDQIHPKIDAKKGKSKDTPIPKPVFVFDSDYEGSSVQLAKCCHPLPGDKIIGIFNSGLGVTVHTKSCETAYKFAEMPELWVEVAWPRASHHRHSGRIKVLLLNEPGSLATMCNVISHHSGNISFIQLEERKLNYFTFILDIEVADIDHLNNIISVLRSDKFVESAERYSF